MSLEVRRKVKKDAPMSIVCQFHCITKLTCISEIYYTTEESRKQKKSSYTMMSCAEDRI